jgi:hypothetical protein
MNDPDRVLAACAAAWLWLSTAIHPAAPWLLVAVIPFGINWTVRTWAPEVWQTIAELGPVGRAASKAWQAIPSAIIGAIIVSLGTGADLKLAAVGALWALVAPVSHEILKAASLSLAAATADRPIYIGGRWPAAGQGPL